MAFLHNPLFVIYASSALVTVANTCLFLWQNRRMKQIALCVAYLKERAANIEQQLPVLQDRLPALEARLAKLAEKSNRRIAA